MIENVDPGTKINFLEKLMPKNRRLGCLGPKNGSRSSGPEKLLKIVSYTETEKLKETMVGPQVE